MSELELQIESLIFSCEQPISLSDIKHAIDTHLQIEIEDNLLHQSIANIIQKYKSELFPFEVIPIAGGYQFMTKGAFHGIVGVHLKQMNKKRLSQAALETLSIIAYKQPLSKNEVEQIRGVSCDYAIQKLLEKELIAIVGRSDGPGRPLLYGTSVKFMDYFGIQTLKDLPQIKDFANEKNEIGENLDIEENKTPS
ncbi:MAG: SMC-Scp complex subunit ScpB [Saprospiraceae bacterium]|nr:SMC-Scp complex subunit ScpB [Saprospiraceae bacterium]